jgi:hypothetical protein
MSAKQIGTDIEVNGSIRGRYPVAAEKSSAFTAELNKLTPIDVSSGAVTCTFPTTGLNSGDWIAVIDSRSNAGTNNITVTVGLYFGTAAQSVTLSANKGGGTFVYIDSTVGWIILP